MEGYCMKCREHKEFEPTENKTYNTKHGIKHAKQGKCPDCGTTISVMVGKQDE